MNLPAKIDPTLRIVTLRQLKKLTPTELAADTSLVIDASVPLAVVVPYGAFLALQAAAEADRA